jgi:DNA repair exonuclease SbcCD ATPase subunit
MILFEKIRWKNLLSTGNHWTEVELNKDSTTLIIGTNGAGKSTILDALCFVLYGKAFRKINKNQLINTTNEKGTLVEIEFSVNQVEWKIERGIKPNTFKIWRNKEELDQKASANDQQKWLEQNVLKMNYKSFTQIVILGSSTFVPFMQLPTSSRREVVEDLLDIKIFSSMNVLIKDKIRGLREEIRTLELRKESLNDKVNMQKNFIEELENRSHLDIETKRDRITQIEKTIDGLMDKNKTTQDEVSVHQETLKEFGGASKRLREYGDFKGKISQKISSHIKEHKFFNENTVCPTCEQDIEESFRVNRMEDSHNKAKELQGEYEQLLQVIKEEELRESKFNQLSGDIGHLLNDISKNNTQISGYQRRIKELESEIQKLTKQLEDRNTEHQKLEEFRETLKDTYEELGKRREDISYYDFTYGLLKDGGVKTKIIKKYLPLINKSVNKYLQMMEFYINFTLDSEFNETIESPIHEDFSYSSFSEGEKMRIDLALLFTWREVARYKNSVNTNLLIMDEVFDSSLDGFGTDEFLKIIRYQITDANIFVISHKTGMEDKFQEVIKFEKCKGFSSKL